MIKKIVSYFRKQTKRMLAGNTKKSLASNETINIPNKAYRIALLQAEKSIRNSPTFVTKDFFKTEHSFSDGLYTRKTTVPKGYYFLTFIHKKSHPAVHVGDVMMIEPTGKRRLQGIHNFITPAGTQRLCYSLEESYCITTHLNPTNERDIDKIEKSIYAEHYNELLSSKELDEELDILTKKEAICQE